MSQIMPPTLQTVRPHRGGIVLALGIIGIVLCGICGIVAWVMGNQDMRDMDAGRMDPSGRGATQAGKICGIIAPILLAIQVCIGLLWMLIAIGVVAAGAAAHKGP